MEISSLGEIIAVRTLEVLASDGSISGTATVKIGKPVDIELGTSYCPYQIFGIGGEQIRYAMGVDSIQALILVLTKIGTDLYTSSESKNGRLIWMEDKSGNLGVPVISEALAGAVPAQTMTLTL